MSGQLKDHVALVTGAGSGIGRAAALRLGMAGARVGLVGLTRAKLEDAAREIDARDFQQALVLPADISDPDAIRGALDRLVETFGRLDFVFANAGINGVWAPLDELTVEDWDQTVRVNLRGTFLTVKHAAARMRAAGGSIVITSSINGTRVFSNSGATAYASTKAALVALAKMLALELAPSAIRVNVICPGSIESQIHARTERRDLARVKPPLRFPEGEVPLTGGRPGRPEDVAELVLFLASPASRHISGTEIWIDGAQSLLRG